MAAWIGTAAAAVAASIKRLALQLTVSVVAATSAAVLAPRVLPLLGWAPAAPAAPQRSALAAPDIDLDGAFLAMTASPGSSFAAAADERPRVILGTASPGGAAASSLHAARPSPLARGCGRACAARAATVAPLPLERPGPPLELAALTVAESREAGPRPMRLFGLALPSAPIRLAQDTAEGTLQAARKAWGHTVGKLFE